MSRTRARWAAVLAAVITGGSVIAMPSAQAADTRPSDAELLSKCDNGTKFCVFHPAGDADIVPGEAHQVGDVAYNCTEDPQMSSRTWEDTTGESNTMGVSLRQELESKFPFGPVFKLAFEESYKRTWASSHTETQTTLLNVPAGEVGWVTRAPRMQKVKGTYELIFKDRFHGKRYWYVPFEATGPTSEQPSVKTQRSRAMTAEERGMYCA
ncbi:hypothetical protein EES43_27780 [Streptomyces sp. ADI96-02]|uniref:hypothetical protein n=1 Tax=unclassified Streptomyces TaxID=2593676 RepID=UPI000F557A46|nr:hypothetical protein [Streptomyces sp. ADI96-02]RPK54870.1 hypothetical protein EES43_27780 [Streptomyces sp. ADI96-02]